MCNIFCLYIKLFIGLAYVETTQCTQFEYKRIFNGLWDALSTMSNCNIVEYFIMISNYNCDSVTPQTIQMYRFKIHIKYCHACTSPPIDWKWIEICVYHQF